MKKNKRKSYAIVGLGRFGCALAYELARDGAEILVVDKDEEKIRELRDITEYAYIVKSLDKKTLIEAGVQNCDVAVVCIGERTDTSVLTAINLLSIGVSKVIAKATSQEHGEILEKIGVEVVYPERDMAIRLANRLSTTKALDFVKLSESINISKIMAPNEYIGRSVLDINIRKQFGLNIIAIENNGRVNDSITPDYIFKNDDILFLSGNKNGIIKLSDWLEKK